MPLKHFPELQLSISVLILRQLITKYWIDFLNEYGAQILQFISFAGHLIRGCREFP